ncbi:hypothetical protein [Reichenbachiella sp.]|uniref:hypothetical protein n=1 Tax=Reichenbachiella sp. TaxID=2184521 RepID=UPI003298AFF7
MISLTQTNHKAAAKFFEKTILAECLKRLKDHKDLFDTHSVQKKTLYDYLKDNMKQILVGDLKTLFDDHNDLLETIFETNYINITPKQFSPFKRAINNVFFYNDHNRWKAYEIIKLIGVDCCPYCNRNYITTVGSDQKKFMRADFDHFLCKKKYPYFRFSFYNLIPSCVICNQKAKGAQTTSLDDNIYPYSDSFGSSAKFYYSPKSYDEIKNGFGSDIRIKPLGKNSKKKEQVIRNIELFRLNEQYSIHHKELHSIIRKKDAHPSSYITAIQQALPKLFKSKADTYDFIFGKSIDEKDFINQPLAKFTKDISEQIGLI